MGNKLQAKYPSTIWSGDSPTRDTSLTDRAADIKDYDQIVAEISAIETDLKNLHTIASAGIMGSIPFVNPIGLLVQDNPNLFYDQVNHRLGVGTNAPTDTITANGGITALGLTGATATSRYAGGTVSGSPASGTFIKGDYVIDQLGQIWICTTAGSPGTWKSAGFPVSDSTELLFDNADPTKKLRLEIGGFTAGQTRVLTPQNANYTIAGLETAQTFTAQQTFTIPPTCGLPALNEAFGYQALYLNLGGSQQNVAFGFQALLAATGAVACAAIGFGALSNFVGGSNNVGLGWAPLYNLIDGQNNLAIGTSSLVDNVHGNGNVAVGEEGLARCLADSNTAIGNLAGWVLTTGIRNVFIGGRANGDRGGTLTTGSYNTFLGSYSDAISASTSYSLGLGYKAIPTSNEAAFGPNITSTSWHGLSSTSVDQTQFIIANAFKTSTNATYAGQVDFKLKDYNATRTFFHAESSGTAILMSFFPGTTPVVQQVDGAALTNNATASGTINQIDDFTSLTVYATDAQAIHNNIYQLARKVKIASDALRAYGLLT